MIAQMVASSIVAGSPVVTTGKFVQAVIDNSNLHEREYLQHLRDGKRFANDFDPRVDGRTREEALGSTLEAIERGDDIIYRGALEIPGWYGIADFLERVPLAPGETSALGDSVCEPIDINADAGSVSVHAKAPECGRKSCADRRGGGCVTESSGATGYERGPAAVRGTLVRAVVLGE